MREREGCRAAGRLAERAHERLSVCMVPTGRLAALSGVPRAAVVRMLAGTALDPGVAARLEGGLRALERTAAWRDYQRGWLALPVTPAAVDAALELERLRPDLGGRLALLRAAAATC